DFSEFVLYYPPPKPYSPCVDYVAPFGSPITLGDYSFFGVHYLNYHQYSSALVAGDMNQAIDGEVQVALREEDPLLGERVLHAVVSISGAQPYKAAILALRATDPTLEYLGWAQDPREGSVPRSCRRKKCAVGHHAAGRGHL